MPYAVGSSRRIYPNPHNPAQLRAALAKAFDDLRQDFTDIERHEVSLEQFLRAANRQAVIDEEGEAGQAVYVVSEGHIALADANVAAKYDVAGVLHFNVPAGGVAQYCAQGVVHIPGWGLTPDATYFLSTTPGVIVANVPIDATGNLAIMVGKALSEDELLVHIGDGVIL